MEKKIGRRGFLKQSLTLGAASAVGVAAAEKDGLAMFKSSKKKGPELAVVTGADYAKDTVKAVEMMGGMGRFVKKGANVAILANSQGRHPGTSTNPQVLKAVIGMCQAAGAAKVSCVSWLSQKNWNDSGLAKAIEEAGATLVLVPRTPESFEDVDIPKAKVLNKTRIIKEYLHADVVIDVPITKDHAGMKFTGTLKNFMGLNDPGSNRNFHKDNWETDPEALNHLNQCIADLNLAVTPSLCVVDATEFVVTNGPFGPGELLKAQKVVVGTDRVAIDSYCATIWGLKGQDIGTITLAYEHGLGEIDLTKVRIKEARA